MNKKHFLELHWFVLTSTFLSHDDERQTSSGADTALD
jgi:hypothetical protein